MELSVVGDVGLMGVDTALEGVPEHEANDLGYGRF